MTTRNVDARRLNVKGLLIAVGLPVVLVGALVATLLGTGAFSRENEGEDASLWLWTTPLGEIARVNGLTAATDVRLDITDAAGNVIYPAEAFMYGGRPSIQIPDNLPQYLYKPSNPEYQVGLNVSYDMPWGLGATFSANYNSDVCAARLCVVKMPAVTIYNAGLRKTFRNWEVKLDATNFTNEHAYRPRQYNGSAGELITAMPLARYNFTARFNFK